MSYSVSTGVVTAEELDAKLDALTTDYPGEMGDAMREHIAEAREAVKRIVASGVMGKGRKFSVGITGHANPGHEPLAGWSNDFMQITITHDPYEPPAPPAPKEDAHE